MVRRGKDDYRWEGVDVHPYKEEGGTHFKGITRQTLYHGEGDLRVELRYFEIAPGGHSTLERHRHAHLVTILRGSGQVLVGDEISEIGERDVVTVPPFTWHQFRASRGEHLGFLCVVSADRDKPQRPGPAELAELRADAAVGEFVRV